MTLTFTYYSPTIPGDAGFSDDLGDEVVRLGAFTVVTNAEQGEAGICNLVLDDPDADVGHSGDAIAGLKQLRITESACPVGNRRLWTGYIADRRYRRGGSGDHPSLLVDQARVIDCSLVDINSFLGFRIFHEDDAERPAETDVERVTWLLTHSYLSSTLFDNGLVETSSGIPMDEADYRGQKAIDVLNDCAQQSGRNYFVYYDETEGEFSLFYHQNDDPVYASDFQLSNVLEDVDNDTVFAPTPDAELTRDPSRVIAGVWMPYSGGNVYRTNPDTAIAFGWRDASAPSVNVKTVAKANARADRYLAENATEDERLVVSAVLPAAHVNDWREGQSAQVRLVHLPGFEEFRLVRALRRTVAQDLQTQEVYRVTWECTPLEPGPQAAFAKKGLGPAVPDLPHETTPGKRLLAFVVQLGNSDSSPVGEPRIQHDGGGGSSADWDNLVNDFTSYTGTGVGRVRIDIMTRLVESGERTTTPVSLLGGDDNVQAAVWLYEIRDFGLPTETSHYSTNETSPPLINNGYMLNGDTLTIPALDGHAVGMIAYQMPDYGGSPSANTTVNGTVLTSADQSNDPTLNAGHGWPIPWQWIGWTADGTALAASITGKVGDTVGFFGAVGCAVVLPGQSRPLPSIPFPANQVEG